MQILIYQKKRSTIDEDPDLIHEAFNTRKDLLIWALENGIRLYYKKALIIDGETGEEQRGTNDIRSEIARIEAEEYEPAEEDNKVIVNDVSGQHIFTDNVCGKLTRSINRIFPSKNLVFQITVSEKVEDLVTAK